MYRGPAGRPRAASCPPSTTASQTTCGLWRLGCTSGVMRGPASHTHASRLSKRAKACRCPPARTAAAVHCICRACPSLKPLPQAPCCCRRCCRLGYRTASTEPNDPLYFVMVHTHTESLL
jgi:hypothetical protein